MKCYRLPAFGLVLMLLAALGADLTASEPDGYRQVTGPCALSFPVDHGPHPGYRTEWWYYTGNLTAAGGQAFGFQLTFFRTRLKPPAGRRTWPQPASPWRTDQIYMAHAALTDISGGRHLQSEKISRPVLSMAGAEHKDATWKIFIGSWEAILSPGGHRLRAEADGFSLDLDLTPVKPLVLHGRGGYSRKGRTPERASCYYSFTRLRAAGAISIGGSSHRVQGQAWMDHEFSTAPLAPDTAGWDWFSLQLSDQSEVMVFVLRQSDGTYSPASGGTYVSPTGDTRALHSADIHLQPLAHWTSPHTGGRYPAQWKLVLNPLDCVLTVTAATADQEMRTPRSTNVDYWEGSVRAKGIKDGRTVEGVGYAELTGYAAPFKAPL